MNACSLCTTASTCYCCCHLQLAAYILLFVFLFINGTNAEQYMSRGVYAYWDSGYYAYDKCLAFYFGLNCVVNIVGFIGVYKGNSKFILYQTIATASYLVIMVANLIVQGLLDLFYSSNLLSVFLVILFILWSTAVFYRIHLWAYYFEQGGIYDVNMLKPPKKSEMAMYVQTQVPVAEAVPAPIPNPEGNNIAH